MPDNREPIEGFDALLAHCRRLSVGCDGKQGFDDKGMAERVASRSRKRGNGKVVVYRCADCKRWHIGNRSDAGRRS
jgi:hypothetical protein